VDANYSTSYVYGQDGQRSNKYTASSETLYFNKMWTLHTDSGNIASGGQYAKNVYLGDTRIVTKLHGARENTIHEEYYKQYFYHSDHLGSATMISDYKGDEYQRIEYTPYGETWVEKTQNTGSEFLPYKFTGKEMDEETGLYYYGARYLDPKYSRWISVDPALGEYIPGAGKSDEADKLPGMGGLFNTVNLSLFHYAGNNPVRYIDPDGRIQMKKDGSVTFFPYSEEPILELGNSDLILLFHWGDIKANDGTNIKVRYNLSDYRPENSNCHGFTFTNGLVWIQPDQVQALLDGDGYNELQKPEAGGIFVQYDDAGMAWHSGKILSVNTTENIIEVIEAMGVTVFKRTDGKLYDTRVHKYRIDEMGTVKFFKNEGDKIVED
jgi:RHS repeat-associated protein